ncbi:hypothetical protein V493_02095 [Pseudogymnoascus sp. VKM F-4281 (FW-2241)]|nr:hypothetical protein V493_02095 [Pseudogymnoascus sp. VKM F-4281 (FW-2241)]
MWDEDKMSGMRLNAIIERLSAPASTLDILVPKLEKECRRFPNVPESVARNAREMHTSVNSFLNSADDGLNYWKKGENALVESDIRQRRPIMRQGPVGDDDLVSGVKSETTEMQKGDRPLRWRRLNSLVIIFTSNNALLAITSIVSIASCIIQARASFASNRLPGKLKESVVDDPDFYNAIQTFLLQVLALYTALAPALRPSVPRYELWAWILTFLSFGAGLASIIVYPFFKALSPLLGCVSGCLQAYVTLALVFSLGKIKPVEDIRKEV